MLRSTRILATLTALVGLLACTTTDSSSFPAASGPAAQMPVALPSLRAPALGLPMHAAPIVGLELLPPQTGEQWRLVSADADGWVRIWADGSLLAAWHAHRGGLAGLALARDGSFYTAGTDGRIHYWAPGTTEPGATMIFGRPISAIAVADEVLALSDGSMIELWSREAAPRRVWWMKAHSFVSGLALSPGGDIIAAAELRQSALLAGAATHPQAEFIEGEALGVDAAEQARLRAQAQATHPGAQADFVEVWEPVLDRHRELIPRAPIDSDLGIRWQDGVIVYREIYTPEDAIVVGRRPADLAHVDLQLIKPWAFWQGSDGNPTPASQQERTPVGDFRVGANDEVLVLDLFPGWAGQPPERGWRVGDRRELAFDANFAAVGDGLGNLGIVAWARPGERGWTAPAEVVVDLVAAAGAKPVLATASLEPRTHYRLWDLDAATHRSVRVEPPWQIELGFDSSTGEATRGPGMYPTRLALDGEATQILTAATSFVAPAQAAVRVIESATGQAEILQVGAGEGSYELGISQDGAHILAWLVGSPSRSWSREGEGRWTPGRPAFAGIPRFSANGRWSAHVSGLERRIVDLEARAAVVALTNTEPPADLGADSLAAIADDGTLILVQPYGGGTLERIDAKGERSFVELPGAATALAWVTNDVGESVGLVGFLDGSIARLDPGVDAVEPIHAGAGGRIWGLEAIAAHPGSFVEHDDRGLTLHRLADGATLELHLTDDSSLVRWAGSPVEADHGEGLVAIWRGGSAQPPCRVLDGAPVGLLVGGEVERWPVERGPELFAAFFDGQVCARPEPAPEEPTPEGEAESEGEAASGAETQTSPEPSSAPVEAAEPAPEG